MTIDIHGYEVKMIGSYIQITDHNIRCPKIVVARGATADRAIARLELLRAMGDDETLRIWLATVYCNGRWS